tara:strand:- start:75 stop:455 length:381 start_codon:yes stop_codon:yes gene_type:complete
MSDIYTSELTDNINKTDKDINKYIENIIENKFSTLVKELNIKNETNNNKMIYEYTLHELYQNTIQSIIDMINDLSEFFSINHKNKTNNEYRTELFNIFLSDKRKLYSGIILIILSLIIYFVDGVSI